MASNIGPLEMLVAMALGLAVPVVAIVVVVRWARQLRSDIRQGAGARGDSVARSEFERLQREVQALKTTGKDTKERTL